ncbi:MAG: error-prone DNA polymerase [Alphaproteobacteria bacterium]
MSGYAELQVTSNFTFLRGASHPEEMMERAAALGLSAIAITDRNSLAGVVRAHIAAKEAKIRLVVGARLDLEDGLGLLAFPCDRAAYGRLARLITTGRRRAPKGECHLSRADLFALAAGHKLVLIPPDSPDAGFAESLRDIAARFRGDVYLGAHHLYRGDDARRIAALARLARSCAVPLVATNDVHMHDPARRPLADMLTCIREKCTIGEAGFRLAANAERHLKSGAEMARLFRHHGDALARGIEIVEAARFSLDELSYEYPDEILTPGRTAQEELAWLTREGARERYPRGIPDKVQASLAHELRLIAELGYAPYFLTVFDLVRFARENGILCQGRGSAANSAVCYCLGVTAVDPARIDLLFERFVSAERNEPPDIDVDFEHERREEVIQYIYRKYGRDRAGLTATVIHYRPRSAIRDVGKAMGLSLDTIAGLAGQIGGGFAEDRLAQDRVRELGLDPKDRTLSSALSLARELTGFPRHLSQHVGGFVITRGPLCEVVPIENAAMEERTVIEWDKDDLDALGILKVDVLGLGMLTCIRKCFALVREVHGRAFTLATVPPEDPAVYDMLSKADSIGVFQVESRAQMNFLPRMKPRTFYDLVIEVAIIRPGPIQGDMVHPYLRRRTGREKAEYPSPELRQVLEKTLGVPLFQEQAMKIAIVAAGFTPSEADQLRRAMATFRRVGLIHKFRAKLVDGMTARGYDRDFAERCFRQIEGFGEYGFPESHAASFALLVYVSAWLKRHYPAAFACALLNSQPMGFYAPAQIVRDASAHGVEVRPVDVNHSAWDCTLEQGAGPALRLGFRQVKGFPEKDAVRLTAARGNFYPDALSLWRRSGLAPSAIETLARADAFGSMGLCRRQALWAVRGLPPAPLPLFSAMGEEEQANEPKVALPDMSLGEEVVEDYTSLRLSLKGHPMALLRGTFDRERIVRTSLLADAPTDARVTVAGLVLVRQRPGSANGVIFMTLEDETGVANVIVWPKTYEQFRRVVLTARLLEVEGTLQREGEVIHVIARTLIDRSERLAWLRDPDRWAPASDPAPEPAPDQVPKPALKSSRRHPRDQAKAPFSSRDFH